jgi:hypothetical protein
MRTGGVLAGMFAISASVACTAHAGSVLVRFDRGAEGWSYYGEPNEYEGVRPEGGNPESFVWGITFDYPIIRNRTNQAFTGNYAARGVRRIGVDFGIFQRLGGTFGQYPLHAVIVTDNGTPEDVSDDWFAMNSSAGDVPLPREGWRTFTFSCDARSEQVPEGWTFAAFFEPPPEGYSWTRLMANVTELGFWTYEPGTADDLPRLIAGVDNARIEFGCLADFDGNASVDFFDYLEFVAALAAEDRLADVTGDGVADFFDYLDFVVALDAGC